MQTVLHERTSKHGKSIKIVLEAEDRGSEVIHRVKALVDGEQLGYTNEIAKLLTPLEGYTHRIGKVVVSEGTAEAAKSFLAEAEQINAQRRAERERQGANKLIRAIYPENGGVEYRLHYDGDGQGYGRCLPERATEAVLGDLEARERFESGWWYNYPISQEEYEAILAWREAPQPVAPTEEPAQPDLPMAAWLAADLYLGNRSLGEALAAIDGERYDPSAPDLGGLTEAEWRASGRKARAMLEQHGQAILDYRAAYQAWQDAGKPDPKPQPKPAEPVHQQPAEPAQPRPVPPKALAAYRRYRGSAERAWEAEDEDAWALIREYEDDIERTYMHPDKAKHQMDEIRREERFGVDPEA